MKPFVPHNEDLPEIQVAFAEQSMDSITRNITVCVKGKTLKEAKQTLDEVMTTVKELKELARK
jgi:NifU-like protein involved in Fe-S cluster formation